MSHLVFEDGTKEKISQPGILQTALHLKDQIDDYPFREEVFLFPNVSREMMKIYQLTYQVGTSVPVFSDDLERLLEENFRELLILSYSLLDLSYIQMLWNYYRSVLKSSDPMDLSDPSESSGFWRNWRIESQILNYPSNGLSLDLLADFYSKAVYKQIPPRISSQKDFYDLWVSLTEKKTVNDRVFSIEGNNRYYLIYLSFYSLGDFLDLYVKKTSQLKLDQVEYVNYFSEEGQIYSLSLNQRKVRIGPDMVNCFKIDPGTIFEGEQRWILERDQVTTVQTKNGDLFTFKNNELSLIESCFRTRNHPSIEFKLEIPLPYSSTFIFTTDRIKIVYKVSNSCYYYFDGEKKLVLKDMYFSPLEEQEINFYYQGQNYSRYCPKILDLSDKLESIEKALDFLISFTPEEFFVRYMEGEKFDIFDVRGDFLYYTKYERQTVFLENDHGLKIIDKGYQKIVKRLGEYEKKFSFINFSLEISSRRGFYKVVFDGKKVSRGFNRLRSKILLKYESPFYEVSLAFEPADGSILSFIIIDLERKKTYNLGFDREGLIIESSIPNPEELIKERLTFENFLEYGLLNHLA